MSRKRAFLTGNRYLWWVVLLLLCSCSSIPQSKAGVKVRGIITKEGRILPPLTVTFWPEDSEKATIQASYDNEGKFFVECPPGRYKVTVEPPKMNGVAQPTVFQDF